MDVAGDGRWSDPRDETRRGAAGGRGAGVEAEGSRSRRVDFRAREPPAVRFSDDECRAAAGTRGGGGGWG